MSNGIVFDRDSARRIANATRGYEQEQSAPESVNYQENGSYGRMMLVRTDSILPSGYTGLMAALGSIIEKLPSGQINIISKVWIKDQNNGTLLANTIYQARLGGTYTQDITTNGITAPTTLGLYLVQTTPTPIAYGYSQARYFGPPIIDAGTGIAYTAIFFEGYTGQRNGVIRTPVYGLAGIDTFLQSLAAIGYYPPVLVKYTEQKAKFGDLIYTGPTLSEVIPFALSSSIIQSGLATGMVYNPLGISGTNYMVNFGYSVLNMFGTVYKWPQVTVLNAYPPTTSGIGSGIGSGISGV